MTDPQEREDVQTEERNVANPNLVILYSGGADSRFMLQLATLQRKTPLCILVDYGQLHKEELAKAEKQLNSFGIEYIRVSVDLKVNSGLTGDGIKNDTGVVHEMHVPGRNTIFISLAYSIAESRNIDTIWYGPDYSDRVNLFPDCYQEYVVKMNELLKLAGPNDIKVEAPLLGLTKEGILEMLDYLGVSKEEIYSGYGDL